MFYRLIGLNAWQGTAIVFDVERKKIFTFDLPIMSRVVEILPVELDYDVAKGGYEGTSFLSDVPENYFENWGSIFLEVGKRQETVHAAERGDKHRPSSSESLLMYLANIPLSGVQGAIEMAERDFIPRREFGKVLRLFVRLQHSAILAQPQHGVLKKRVRELIAYCEVLAFQ